MHTVTKRWLWGIVFASLILAGLVTGQEEEKVERKKNTFSVIALTDLPFEKLYYRYNKKATTINASGARRSPQYPLSSSSDVFEIYTDNNDPDKPEIRYKLVGRAESIASSKALYFLRKSDSQAQDALPIEMFGLDDSEAKFPESSFRFISFMKVPLYIEFDNNQFSIKPNDVKVQKLKLSKEGAFTPFIVKDTKGKLLGGTRLFSHSGNREMVLIFPPKKDRKRLDIRYFSD